MYTYPHPIRRFLDIVTLFLALAVAMSDVQMLAALSDTDSDLPTTFIVTAYYSPLPGQSFYTRGSYEADRRLNGDGVRGASGKSVYAGMLAGPKVFGFGTRIYLRGLGIGTVDDRGGAIVSSGGTGPAYDRIDVWMGYGEEGLRRALAFGRRKVSGRILGADEKVDNYDDIILDNFSESTVNAEDYMSRFTPSERKTRDYLAYTANDTESTFDTIFQHGLAYGNQTNNAKNLKKILAELSYYYGDIDGTLSESLTDAIILFQIHEGIISGANDTVAGIYGPKTRSHLKSAYTQFRDGVKSRRVALSNAVTQTEQSNAQRETRKSVIETTDREMTIAAAKARKRHEQTVRTIVDSLGNPQSGEVGSHVRSLQKALKELGYFPYKDTAIFGPKTQNALAKYQMDRGLLADATKRNDTAGVLTDDTKSALTKDLLALKGVNTEVAMR